MAGDDKKPVEDNKDADALTQVSQDKLPEQKIPTDKMKVKIYAPFKTYFNGIADNMSGVNATGPFDILRGHKNFMAILNACELVVRNDGKEEKIKINRGVMHVKADAVIVFLDV